VFLLFCTTQFPNDEIPWVGFAFHKQGSWEEALSHLIHLQLILSLFVSLLFQLCSFAYSRGRLAGIQPHPFFVFSKQIKILNPKPFFCFQKD
jgi:hypothetical protein